MSEGRQMIPLSGQIDEADLAFRLREREIAAQVARGTIRQSVGALHMARLQAARATLRWLEKHEAKIKARVAGEPS